MGSVMDGMGWEWKGKEEELKKGNSKVEKGRDKKYKNVRVEEGKGKEGDGYQGTKQHEKR